MARTKAHYFSFYYDEGKVSEDKPKSDVNYRFLINNNDDEPFITIEIEIEKQGNKKETVRLAVYEISSKIFYLNMEERAFLKMLNNKIRIYIIHEFFKTGE